MIKHLRPHCEAVCENERAGRGHDEHQVLKSSQISFPRRLAVQRGPSFSPTPSAEQAYCQAGQGTDPSGPSQACRGPRPTLRMRPPGTGAASRSGYLLQHGSGVVGLVLAPQEQQASPPGDVACIALCQPYFGDCRRAPVPSRERHSCQSVSLTSV